MLWDNISSQFGKPRGILGNLAGFIMANRKSNVERNNWSIKLAKILPTDNVLEIGFGPGNNVRKISEIVKDGCVYGLDHSDLMVKRAKRRNKKGIDSKKVNLILGSVSHLPAFEVSFDKIIDVNSFQFWDDQVASLRNLRQCLRENGRILIVHQPRDPGATDNDAIECGNEFGKKLTEAGFAIEKIQINNMKPVSSVCVIGVKQPNY